MLLVVWLVNRFVDYWSGLGDVPVPWVASGEGLICEYIPFLPFCTLDLSGFLSTTYVLI